MTGVDFIKKRGAERLFTKNPVNAARAVTSLWHKASMEQLGGFHNLAPPPI